MHRLKMSKLHLHSLKAKRLGARLRIATTMLHRIRIVIVHIDLIAQCRNLLAASLMESIVALIAVQTGEEQATTAFAEGERKECFADKLK